MSMEFRVLGPVETWCGGSMAPVPSGRQTAVLAALLLQANRVVSVPQLVEALWASVPPQSARATVENHIKRLRQTLGEPGRHRIVTRRPGYLIRVDANELDVSRFEAHLTAAKDAAGAGLWALSADRSRAALALWRGEPLANVGSAALAMREVPRLREMCLAAAELNMSAAIRIGRYSEVIGELRRLTAANPFRERFYALLMTALHGDGRHAEALAVYQQARGILLADLGCEPGQQLRELHQQILCNDVRLPGNPPGTGRVAGQPVVLCRRSGAAWGSSRDARSSRFCRGVRRS